MARYSRFRYILCCIMGVAVVAHPTPLWANLSAPRTGAWRAWLDSPGGQLPFGLRLVLDGVRWRAWLVNGSERIEVPRVTWSGDELALSIDYYDSTITAQSSANGTRLDGQWTKRAAGGKLTRMAFHAQLGDPQRFHRGMGPITRAKGDPIDGRWLVKFSGSDQPAVALLETRLKNVIRGTFLTTTGDYRYLAGNRYGPRLLLSCFDGAHAFLFDARIEPEDTLKGDFWSRDSWHETWTAKRDNNAALPEPFSLTRWTGRVALGSLTFPDLDGTLRSLDDPAFQGKARIIEVFGSWCPNCRDASRFLVELDRRYRQRGLRILGLAFELSGDFKRDAAQVRTYAQRLQIHYPILIAGVSDKDKASAALPVLDRVRAYPTTLFLDAAGRVRAVHTGFSGPATGEEYQKLRARFEKMIEELLSS